MTALDVALADETRALSLSAPAPSRALLDELILGADAGRAELDAINGAMLRITDEINGLVITRYARRRVFWRRWRPDQSLDNRLDALRTERRRLDGHFAELHPGFVSAVAAQARAETDFKKETAEAKAARALAKSRWRSEQDVVARASAGRDMAGHRLRGRGIAAAHCAPDRGCSAKRVS